MFNILLFLIMPVTCISCKQAEHGEAEGLKRTKRKRTPTEKAAEGEKTKKKKNKAEKAKSASAKADSAAAIPTMTPEQQEMFQDLEESESIEPPPEVGYFLLTSKVIIFTVFFSREDEEVPKTPFFYMSNGKN